MSKVYIIHENEEWTIHLTKRLEELEVPYESWFLDEGFVPTDEVPPEGIYFSRMSASSHTRDHRFAPELASMLFSWLEENGRTVYNGSSALKLELSKVHQYAALRRQGIRTPLTIAAVGKKQIIEASKKLNKPSFIIKHNRAGKGLGVQLFHSIEALESYVYGPSFEEPVDGVTLVQEYIQSKEKHITRCEFVGGKFLYAVSVDTSEGFELCPADACQVNDQFCPVGETETDHKFQILKDFSHPIIQQYEAFLKENHIQVAGIEFIRDEEGNIFTYDVNTNTNYNKDAEEKAGTYGMLTLAGFLQSQLLALAH